MCVLLLKKFHGYDFGTPILMDYCQMVQRSFLLLQLLATLGAGLIAGTFFCFSSFVMPALAKLEPAQGVAAMQKINITVINPLFMAVLFGTAVLFAFQAFWVFRSGIDSVSVFWLAAAILYVPLTIGITLFCNVPLNDQLARITMHNTSDLEFWHHYMEKWTLWNSLRGLAAASACTASIYAISASR
jgi:uncharacterized membrane protein